jgi:hypothetical protein
MFRLVVQVMTLFILVRYQRFGGTFPATSGSIPIYQTTRCHNPEGHSMNISSKTPNLTW